MVSEVILASEGFSTNFTTIWPFVRVCAFMNQQVVTLCEMTTTILANKLLFCPEMRINYVCWNYHLLKVLYTYLVKNVSRTTVNEGQCDTECQIKK